MSIFVFNFCGKSIGASAKIHPTIKKLLRTRDGSRAIVELVQRNKYSGVRSFKIEDLRRWISYLGS